MKKQNIAGHHYSMDFTFKNKIDEKQIKSYGCSQKSLKKQIRIKEIKILLLKDEKTKQQKTSDIWCSHKSLY